MHSYRDIGGKYRDDFKIFDNFDHFETIFQTVSKCFLRIKHPKCVTTKQLTIQYAFRRKLCSKNAPIHSQKGRIYLLFRPY